MFKKRAFNSKLRNNKIDKILKTGKNLFLTAFIILLSIYQIQCNKKSSSEPNIVLIVLDTLRADHLPFYGYEKNTAPFLAEIASRSIIFENAYSASSWTAPATASIFTSLYPFQHGVTTGLMAGKFFKVKQNSIPGKIKTIAEVLKENGYRTYCVADNINICKEQGFKQGFDWFKLLPYQLETRTNIQLEKWAEVIKAQKKYFLYIHYNDCHLPFHKREPWYEKKESEMDDMISRYDSEINYVDAKIKKMYELYGWNKNTLLIITADHGEEFWDHSRFGHGISLYSELIHVPLLIQFTDSDRIHKRISVNVSNMDILPTVRQYLGFKDSGTTEGIGLLPLIHGKEKNLHQRNIFSHLMKHNKHNKQKNGIMEVHKASIYRNWKSIIIYHVNKYQEKKLYNLEKDPGETYNVYEKNKLIAHRLFKKFSDFEMHCKIFEQNFENVTLDKKKIKELKTLGYVK
jgi:arylsulfatase A-like enzyme